MSEHVEWGTVSHALPLLRIEEPGDVEDAYGSRNERPALVIDTGSSVFVLEGTSEELSAFAKRVAELERNYYGPEELEPEDAEQDEDEEVSA